MRLQKYIAQCGIASRRAAEVMIADGRVAVNGKTVTEMGVKVENGDTVTVDGTAVSLKNEYIYILFNKPRAVMTTMSDKEGRKCVADYFKDLGHRVYPVGRLDYMTDGLLIMTNDGDLANALTHPRHQVYKHYSALVDKIPEEEDIEKLRSGVELSDGITLPAKAKAYKTSDGRGVVAISIREGRNRQVRRMLEKLGYEVVALRRTGVGELTADGVEPGEWRYLTPEEVAYLKRISGL